MTQIGLLRAVRGKAIKTTQSDTAAPCPQDKVNRQFRAPAPDMLWVSDFNYVSTWAGFVYVAFVIDTFANHIVGWRVSGSAKTDFVLDALEQALYKRRPDGDGSLVHHSDRGSQYVSIRYTERLADAGIEPSVAAIVTRTDGVPRRPSETATTTHWPRRSMASTRPRSFAVAALGKTSRPSRWRPSNGWIGSTTADCLNPSGTSRLPRLKPTPMRSVPRSIWSHKVKQLVSGKPGAVQLIRSSVSSVIFRSTSASFSLATALTSAPARSRSV